MSSSSSDHVIPSVRPFVRPIWFFYFAFNSSLGQDLWHLWSIKWPRTIVKVSHALLKQFCWSLKLKYEIWIRPLQLKFDIECFAFDFWRLRLAFKRLKDTDCMLRVVCCLLNVEAIWSLDFLCNHQLKKWHCYLSSSQLPRSLFFIRFRDFKTIITWELPNSICFYDNFVQWQYSEVVVVNENVKISQSYKHMKFKLYFFVKLFMQGKKDGGWNCLWSTRK